MRTHWRTEFVLIVLVAAHASAGELLLTGGVLNIFAEVLRLGSFGLRDVETAAFVVREEDGSYRCELWPPTNQFHATRFRWPPPPNAVAIVHTHPASSPRSSHVDRETAMRLAIPVYSLTIANVYMVDALGVSRPLIRNRHWFEDGNLWTRNCSPFRPVDLLPPRPARTRTVADEGCADDAGFHVPRIARCLP